MLNLSGSQASGRCSQLRGGGGAGPVMNGAKVRKPQGPLADGEKVGEGYYVLTFGRL